MRTVPALALGLALVASAACGGDGGAGATTTSPPTPFCAGVAAVAGTDLDTRLRSGEEDEIADGLEQLEGVRDDAPAAVADEAAVMVAFVELVLDEFDLFHDPDRAEELEDEHADDVLEYAEARAAFDEFTLDECRITLAGATPDVSLTTFAGHVADCRAGDMRTCDTLYAETPIGSLAEAVARECGGEDPGGDHRGDCHDAFG